MLSSTQIIILIGNTTLFLLVFPYLTFRYQKKLNRNRMFPESLWPKVFLSLFLGIILVSVHLWILYPNSHHFMKDKSLPVPAPQIETKAEYYYKKGEYGHDITSTKYVLTEEDKPFLNTQGKWMLNKVGEISKPQIERTYTFFGFNGLYQCKHPEIVPKDLPPFIREPFNNWYYTGKMKPYDDSLLGLSHSDINYFDASYFTIDVSNRDSKFYPNGFVKKHGDTIMMDYDGPKHLLEEDQDFYIDTVQCPLEQRTKGDYRTANYYLHFNPVKQYITLYTEKKNPKEN